jgi:hypothetical protein
VAAGDVDDGQAPVAQRHAAARRLPDAFVVGPAVHQRAAIAASCAGGSAERSRRQ